MVSRLYKLCELFLILNPVSYGFAGIQMKLMIANKAEDHTNTYTNLKKEPLQIHSLMRSMVTECLEPTPDYTEDAKL